MSRPDLRTYATERERYAASLERPLRVPTFRRRNVLANLALALALWAAIGLALVLIFGGR